MAVLDINLLPKQKLLLKAIESGKWKWIGFGGARGGSKSNAVRNIALILALKYGVKVLIMRRYREELLENHIYPMFMDFPQLRKLFNKQEMTIRHPTTGLPMIRFGYAEFEQDIYTFQGTEYQVIFIDEATQFTETQILFLSTSNRDSQHRLKKAAMVLTMNPGGASHAYIKRLFIDKRYVDNENPDDYFFIQASVWDNVFWVLPELHRKGLTIDHYYKKFTEEERKKFTLKHSEYAKALASLPEDMREAYLEGNWDVFGGMFFKGLDRKHQIIEPFDIPREWKVIGAIDPGFSSPCAFGILAQDFEKNIYVVGVYYEKQRSPQQHARAIKKFIESNIYLRGHKPSYIVSGKDAFAKKDRYSILANERTFADEFQAQGLTLIPAVTDRINGWWAIKSLLPDKLFFFKGMCDPLIEEMSAVVSDPKQPEDIQGRGNDSSIPDHAIDMLRYGVMSLHQPKRTKDMGLPFWAKKRKLQMLKERTVMSA